MIGSIVQIERRLDSAVGPISLAEWKAAVSTVDGVRLQTEETIIINPRKPEQTIRVPLREGNVEVYFPTGDFWIPAITWAVGRAKFREPRVKDAADPVLIAARHLASLLGAEICGIKGESFDARC